MTNRQIEDDGEREKRETAADNERERETDTAYTTLHGLYLKIVCVSERKLLIFQ